MHGACMHIYGELVLIDDIADGHLAARAPLYHCMASRFGTCTCA